MERAMERAVRTAAACIPIQVGSHPEEEENDRECTRLMYHASDIRVEEGGVEEETKKPIGRCRESGEGAPGWKCFSVCAVALSPFRLRQAAIWRHGRLSPHCSLLRKNSCTLYRVFGTSS